MTMRAKRSVLEIDRHPTFGAAPTGARCKVRRAAYAVIFGPNGNVAAVRGKAGVFLPGGGSLPNEAPVSTLLRELKEECGCAARIVHELGQATQYFMVAKR